MICVKINGTTATNNPGLNASTPSSGSCQDLVSIRIVTSSGHAGRSERAGERAGEHAFEPSAALYPSPTSEYSRHFPAPSTDEVFVSSASENFSGAEREQRRKKKRIDLNKRNLRLLKRVRSKIFNSSSNEIMAESGDKGQSRTARPRPRIPKSRSLVTCLPSYKNAPQSEKGCLRHVELMLKLPPSGQVWNEALSSARQRRQCRMAKKKWRKLRPSQSMSELRSAV